MVAAGKEPRRGVWVHTARSGDAARREQGRRNGSEFLKRHASMPPMSRTGIQTAAVLVALVAGVVTGLFARFTMKEEPATAFRGFYDQGTYRRR